MIPSPAKRGRGHDEAGRGRPVPPTQSQSRTFHQNPIKQVHYDVIPIRISLSSSSVQVRGWRAGRPAFSAPIRCPRRHWPRKTVSAAPVWCAAASPRRCIVYASALCGRIRGCPRLRLDGSVTGHFDLAHARLQQRYRTIARHLPRSTGRVLSENNVNRSSKNALSSKTPITVYLKKIRPRGHPPKHILNANRRLSLT
jgi:hypothetical protein